MPAMADIVVKKNDGTTDITYNAMTPSSGDKTPARWRCESIGTVAGNRPTLELMSKSSVNGQYRVVESKDVYPETFTDSNTGLVKIRDRVLVEARAVVPLNAADAIVAEATAQSINLLKSNLVQLVFKTGFAPT